MILKLVILLLVVSLSTSQDSCPSSNGMIGFTALTPEQLRTEIRDNIQQTSGELLSEVREILSEDAEKTKQDIEASLDKAIERMTGLNEQLEASLLSRMEAVIEKEIRDTLNKVLNELTIQPPITASPATEKPSTAAPTTQPLPTIGLSPIDPATSCQQILEAIPNAASGLYWLKSTNELPSRVYCEMGTVCGGLSGGWISVAELDMREPGQSCPPSFTAVNTTNSELTLCATLGTLAGCYSALFPVYSVPYTQVCGRVIGYQDKTPNGFYPFHNNPSRTINDVYVDGVSLTQGDPREHIWTFVAGLDESLGHLSACSCSNNRALFTANVPPFVGDDYFCDTGSREDARFIFYSDDPLWDGKGCGESSTCCKFNNPPWFVKNLQESASGDLELRVCRDSPIQNEDLPLQVVELFVR